MSNSFFRDFSKVSIIPYLSYLIALLAVTFDVGYFSALDINLFTIFSVSEHLLFSLEAIPTAMLTIGGIILVYFIWRYDIQRSVLRSKKFSVTHLRIGQYSQTFFLTAIPLLGLYFVPAPGRLGFACGVFSIAVSIAIVIECTIRRFDVARTFAILA